MTISPIPFLIWQDILLKDKFSSIDSFTINKSIHQSMSCLLSLVWWRKLLKRTEKITPQSQISSMPIMQLLRILQQWRQLLVNRYFEKIILGFNWRRSHSFGILEEIWNWVHCSRSILISRTLWFIGNCMETSFSLSSRELVQNISWYYQAFP